MILRWLALLVLAAASAQLVMGLRQRPGRHGRIGLVGAGFGLALALVSLMGDGIDLVDVYLVAAFGALAMAARDEQIHATAGVALVAVALSLLAATSGAVAPAAPLAPGPAALLLTLAAGSGALAAIALGRVRRAGLGPSMLLAIGLLVLLTVHRPTESHPDWWGVMAGLRQAQDALFLFAPEALGQLGSPYTVTSPNAGLLALTAVIAVVAMAALPAQRRHLATAGGVLALGALGLLLADGVLLPQAGEVVAGLVAWTRDGLLTPPVTGGEVFVDLATVLPTAMAYALAVGLLGEQALPVWNKQDEVDPFGAPDLDVAVAVGAVLLAGLFAVWREVWGAPLGAGVAPVLVAAALVTLGFRLGLPSRRAGAWGAAVLLLAGASQLPAGSLPALL